ncbi:hypothetical protein KI809_17070 [Geobacter pelophilus]|uniref:Uncharacterized protein n=1 Tax=Geoanaerobacter pelophilus TaxID=60036 RepID=A0AAW4LFS2_9BACT|nr:hypothetical protein [Geoanaerobacter pelophilus]MBT0666026.1 hypothetical protein [Geoanaerobacter pelophilus]
MSIRPELEDEIKSMKARGIFNYSIHYSLSVVAIFASFIASLSAALGVKEPLFLSIISAVPAAVLIA